MQFQIPQFIDVESKLVGPLTLRQFLYLVGAGGVSALAWFMFAGWLWFLTTAVAAAIGISLAFVKYQGRPLPQVALYAFGFLWKPRLYLWQKEKEKTLEDDISKIKIPGEQTRKSLFQMATVKKLMQDLLTTKKPIGKREKNSPEALFVVLRKSSGEKTIVKQVNY